MQHHIDGFFCICFREWSAACVVVLTPAIVVDQDAITSTEGRPSIKTEIGLGKSRRRTPKGLTSLRSLRLQTHTPEVRSPAKEPQQRRWLQRWVPPMHSLLKFWLINSEYTGLLVGSSRVRRAITRIFNPDILLLFKDYREMHEKNYWR